MKSIIECEATFVIEWTFIIIRGYQDSILQPQNGLVLQSTILLLVHVTCSACLPIVLNMFRKHVQEWSAGQM